MPFRYTWLCIPLPCVLASAKATFELGSTAAELKEASVSRPGSQNWNMAHGHCNGQIRLMIGIDSKYLHKMVPSWHRHWRFHAQESCYSLSNSPANPWKPFARDPEIGSRTGPKFWEIRPEKFPPKKLKFARNFRSYIYFEWLKCFRLVIWKISGSGRWSKTKISGSPRFKISVRIETDLTVDFSVFVCSPPLKDLKWQLWKGNCVDPNNEAPSFRDSFGLDTVAEPR